MATKKCCIYAAFGVSQTPNNWEECKEDIKTRREFWIPKIERNIQRDLEVNAALTEAGWTVLRFWGKDIKKHCSECADIIERKVRGV